MPDNKDELLKQQNEEIQKLKKELKAATKPSSMLSVLKSAVRRNVHDFFIREDKIKSVQEENKKLKKELEETKEERDKTSAQLFAATAVHITFLVSALSPPSFNNSHFVYSNY